MGTLLSCLTLISDLEDKVFKGGWIDRSFIDLIEVCGESVCVCVCVY